MNSARILEAAKGVVATSLTPFTDAGEIDFAALRQNAEHLAEGGADIIVPAGNTAEHSSLTPEEVAKITEVVVEAVAGQAVVVTGVGGPLPSLLKLAREVGALGVDGVMIHEPAHVHASEEGTAGYIEAVCDAIPDMAVFPYKRNEARLPDSVLARVLAKPNLLGVKYAGRDVREAQALVLRTRAAYPDTAWVNGLAETWAPAFHAVGMPGFTSGLVNVAPHLSSALRDALRANDQARVEALWARVKPFEDLRAKYKSAYNVPVVKEAAAQLGYCKATVRLPLTELRDEDKKEVTQILKDWELL